MTGTTIVPMAMFPRASQHARELAQRMLQLTADEPADISERATAAMYVMAAWIALDDNRAKIIDAMGNTVAALVKANRVQAAELNQSTSNDIQQMKWFIDIGDDSDSPGGWAVYSAEYNEELARDHYASLTKDGGCDLRLRRAPHVLDLGEIVAAHFGGPSSYWRNEEKPHIAPHLKPGSDPFRYTE
jgi:hypothetical protein